MPPRIRFDCLLLRSTTPRAAIGSTAAARSRLLPQQQQQPLLLNVLPSTTSTSTTIPSQIRLASGISKQLRARGGGGGQVKRDSKGNVKKKKEPRKSYRCFDIRDAERFPLVEAVRYFRAFEVGKDPKSVKYELAVKLKTPISGNTIKNNIRLPHTVKTNMKICVFAEGAQAKAAKEAGAYLVGTEDLWKEIKAGRKDFNRCIAHRAVVPAMNKSGIGRALGPRGLMPSEKLGTVLPDVGGAVQVMLGTEIYRERVGVVRVAIGQLAFTNQQLADNIKAFMAQLRGDIARLDTEKSIHEVVLSTTHGPGISLSGELQAERPVGEVEAAKKKVVVKVARPKRIATGVASKKAATKASAKATDETPKQAIPA